MAKLLPDGSVKAQRPSELKNTRGWNTLGIEKDDRVVNGDQYFVNNDARTVWSGTYYPGQDTTEEDGFYNTVDNFVGLPLYAVAWRQKADKMVRPGDTYGTLFGKDGWELPGKVVMERILRWANKTIDHSAMPDAADYRFYKDFKSQHAIVMFQWCIESQIYPKTYYSSNGAINSTLITRFDREFRDSSQNAPIDNIYISIRQLRGSKATTKDPKNDIQGMTGFTNGDLESPGSYTEIGYITVPAEDTVGTTTGYGVNDNFKSIYNEPTGKGVNNTRGYGVNRIIFQSSGDAWLVLQDLSDDSIWEKRNNPESYPNIFKKLIITWTGKEQLAKDGTPLYPIDSGAANPSDLMPDGHFWLTVQPRNHPEERLKYYEKYITTIDWGHLSVKADGYYGRERIWPYSYHSQTYRFYVTTKSTSWPRFWGGMYGFGSPVNGKTQQVCDNGGAVGSIPNATLSKQNLGTNKWTFNKRHSKKKPYEGGWSYLNDNGTLPVLETNLGKPSDYFDTDRPLRGLSKGGYFDDNDSKIPLDAFLDYGLNISSYVENQVERASSAWAGMALADTGRYDANKGYVVDLYHGPKTPAEFARHMNLIVRERMTKRDYWGEVINDFAWFYTPPQEKTEGPKDITVPSTATVPLNKPFIGNEGHEIETVSVDTYKIKLNASFYYDTINLWKVSDFSAIEYLYTQLKPKIDGYDGMLKTPFELPLQAGFRWRDAAGANLNWQVVTKLFDLNTRNFDEYVRANNGDLSIKKDLSKNDPTGEKYTLTNGTARKITFQHVLEGIKLEQNIEYQIWVRRRDGSYYYADPNKTLNSLGFGPTTYNVRNGEVSLGSYVEPNWNESGRWYQIFDSWEFVKTDPDKLLVPYLTVRSFGGFFPKNPADGPHSIHYYLNRRFLSGKTYQFRVVVEDYYNGLNPATNTTDNLSVGNFEIRLPWGETFAFQRPFLPTKLSNDAVVKTASPNRFNLYVYSNINAYDLKSGPQKPIRSLLSTSNPQNPLTFRADTDDVYRGQRKRFTISYFGINEHEWLIQGYGQFSSMVQTTPGTVKPIGTERPVFLDPNSGELMGAKGWHYLPNEKQLLWFDRIGPRNPQSNSDKIDYRMDIDKNLPVGGLTTDYLSGKSASAEYLINNFAATYVPHQTFNLTFDYENWSGFGIKMYLTGDLPRLVEGTTRTNIDELIENRLMVEVADISTNVPNGVKRELSFVGLTGNQYLIFIADPLIRFFDPNNLGIWIQNVFLSNNEPKIKIEPNLGAGYDLTNGARGFGTYSLISLSNFKFSAAYSSQNNKVTQTNDKNSGSLSAITSGLDFTPSPDLQGVKYSMELGSKNSVTPNAPNSLTTVYTKAGNGSFVSGIWENGVWNNGWRDDYTVRDFSSIVEFYEVSIGTFRIKLFGEASSVSQFRIADRVSVSNIIIIDINDERKLWKNYMTVVDTSEQAKYILLEFTYNFPIRTMEMDSKNHRILVSRNVWLKGVFFNGNFRGIWNDGLFSGYPLITKMENVHWIDGVFNGGHFYATKFRKTFAKMKDFVINSAYAPQTSIEFQSPHRLAVGDIISITYSTPTNIKTLGTTTVIRVPSENEVVLAVKWDKEFIPVIDGTLYSTTSTGLIQNFSFYANNVSTVTSIESMISSRVFSYTSWIDVNYSDQSAVNIGRPENYNDPTSNRQFSENNLFGYPTNDVLTSVSVFRDSFSLSLRKYRLGKRYKIFADFVGDSSQFEDYFDSTDTPGGLLEFNNNGWTANTRQDISVTLFSASQSYTEIVPNDSYHLDLYLYNNEAIDSLKVGNEIEISGPFTETNIGPFGTNYNHYVKSAKTNILSKQEVGGGLVKITTDSVSTFTQPQSYWDLEAKESKKYESTDFSLSFIRDNGLTFSRTNQATNGNASLVGKELNVKSVGSGGVLNLIPAYDVPNRNNTNEKRTIDKFRYSMVEFDVLSIQGSTSSNTYVDPSLGGLPIIHFNNLNLVQREVAYKDEKGGQKNELLYFPATYLPIYKNVNHANTIGVKKQEFFFNKRNLMMNFTGTGIYGMKNIEYFLDNLKLYEVDMIPFFKYFTRANINFSVQIPNSTDIYGTAPIIGFGEYESTGNDNVQAFYNLLLNVPTLIPNKINWELDYTLFADDFGNNPLAELYGNTKSTIITGKTTGNSNDGEAGTGATNTETNTNDVFGGTGTTTVGTTGTWTTGIPDPNSGGLSPSGFQNAQSV